MRRSASVLPLAVAAATLIAFAAPVSAQGSEPSKAAAAAKKATTATKPAPAAKRLDFAPTAPVAATPVAPSKAMPASTAPSGGKSESNCHSSGSDA
jgi:hypothetical protein